MTVAREMKEERSADDAGNNLREEVRNILTALEADEDIDNLEEEEVTITEEIAEVLEKSQTSYQLTEMYQRRTYQRKLLRLIKFCVNSKHTTLQKLTNELLYAGAVAVTNSLEMKINKAAERNEPTRRRRLQNKITELQKELNQLKLLE